MNTTDSRDVVLLFDVDGTLLSTDGAGSEALRRAFQAELGWAQSLAAVMFAGRTDRSLVREGLLRGGYSADHYDAGDVEARIDAILARYLPLVEEELARAVPAGRGEVYPGVLALLDALEERDSGPLHVGLLTGNVAEGARRKLEAYGVWRDLFRFGAYGSDDEDRNALVPIALARAAALAGRPLRRPRVVVIGDTPKDVEAAKSHEAACLGVATARYGVEALLAAGADAAIPNLTDTAAVLAYLLTERAFPDSA